MDLEQDNGVLPPAAAKAAPVVELTTLPDIGANQTEIINAFLKTSSPLAPKLNQSLTSIQATLNEVFPVQDRVATLSGLNDLSDKTLTSLVGALNLPEQQRQKILDDLAQGGTKKDAAVETLATKLAQALQNRDASLINVAEILSADQAFQDAHPELAARLLSSLREVVKTLRGDKDESVDQPMAAEFTEFPVFSVPANQTAPINQGNNHDPLAPIVAEAVIATAVVFALANAAAAEEREKKDQLQRAMEEAERMQKEAEERVRSAISAFEARTGHNVPANFDVAYRTDPPSDAELRSALPESERAEEQAA